MKKTLLRIACALLPLCLSACDQAVQFNTTDVTGVKYGPALSMPDQHGKLRSLPEFSGKLVAVFFGYTNCPDVCPTSLAQLADIKKQLGADGERLQTIFVTVDPQRDTPEFLARYMAAFDPSFIALRGDLAQTDAVVKEFNAYYAFRGDVASGKYTVDHTAGIYLFDPQGRPRLFARHGETAERILHDMRLLLAGK